MTTSTQWVRVGAAAAAVWLVLAAAACVKPSDASDPSPQPQPPAPQDGTVKGTERIGWIQQVSAGTAVADYTFVVYVDGERRPVPNVTCAPLQGSRHSACETPLPQLTPGSHTLRFAAIRIVGGQPRESAQSEPLTVVMAQAAEAPAGTPDRVPHDAVNRRVRPVEIVGRGLTAPADIAVAPDGRIFVAERSGTIRILHADEPAEPAARLTDVLDEPGFGFQSITLHPRFLRNQWVYVAYVGVSRDAAPVFRVSRFREAGGRLGERVVLLDDVPAVEGARVAVRFGPDERLYVSVGDSEPSTAARLASFNGKVLRLDEEGRRPDDNPLPTVIYSTSSPRPDALAVAPGGGTWTVERTDWGGVLRLAQPASAFDSSKASAPAIPLAFAPSGLAVEGHPAAVEGHGESLLVASRTAEDIFRIVVGPTLPARAASTQGSRAKPERLLAGRFGPIGAVALGPDGSIFFSTDRGVEDEITPGDDYVGRIVPPRSTASQR